MESPRFAGHGVDQSETDLMSGDAELVQQIGLCNSLDEKLSRRAARPDGRLRRAAIPPRVANSDPSEARSTIHSRAAPYIPGPPMPVGGILEWLDAPSRSTLALRRAESSQNAVFVALHL